MVRVPARYLNLNRNQEVPAIEEGTVYVSCDGCDAACNGYVQGFFFRCASCRHDLCQNCYELLILKPAYFPTKASDQRLRAKLIKKHPNHQFFFMGMAPDPAKICVTAPEKKRRTPGKAEVCIAPPEKQQRTTQENKLISLPPQTIEESSVTKNAKRKRKSVRRKSIPSLSPRSAFVDTKNAKQIDMAVRSSNSSNMRKGLVPSPCLHTRRSSPSESSHSDAELILPHGMSSGTPEEGGSRREKLPLVQKYRAANVLTEPDYINVNCIETPSENANETLSSVLIQAESNDRVANFEYMMMAHEVDLDYSNDIDSFDVVEVDHDQPLARLRPHLGTKINTTRSHWKATKIYPVYRETSFKTEKKALVRFFSSHVVENMELYIFLAEYSAHETPVSELLFVCNDNTVVRVTLGSQTITAMDTLVHDIDRNIFTEEGHRKVRYSAVRITYCNRHAVYVIELPIEELQLSFLKVQNKGPLSRTERSSVPGVEATLCEAHGTVAHYSDVIYRCRLEASQMVSCPIARGALLWAMRGSLLAIGFVCGDVLIFTLEQRTLRPCGRCNLRMQSLCQPVRVCDSHDLSYSVQHAWKHCCLEVREQECSTPATATMTTSIVIFGTVNLLIVLEVRPNCTPKALYRETLDSTIACVEEYYTPDSTSRYSASFNVILGDGSWMLFDVTINKHPRPVVHKRYVSGSSDKIPWWVDYDTVFVGDSAIGIPEVGSCGDRTESNITNAKPVQSQKSMLFVRSRQNNSAAFSYNWYPWANSDPEGGRTGVSVPSIPPRCISSSTTLVHCPVEGALYRFVPK